jgi:Glycosyl transferase family 2
MGRLNGGVMSSKSGVLSISSVLSNDTTSSTSNSPQSSISEYEQKKSDDQYLDDQYLQEQSGQLVVISGQKRTYGEPKIASASTLEQFLGPKISVVIPTRNEALNLPHVLPFLPASLAEVILVDGHSIDETIKEAQRLRPSIKIIKQVGKGKGDALREGFAACTGEIIVTLDADGSADPTEIPRFVEVLLQGNDFAKGSRFLKGGGSDDITAIRYLGNMALSAVVNVLFGTKFTDLCYGYNAFWKRCLDHMVLECTGFEIETFINLRMHKAKLKIAEVPSFEHARIHGESNLRTWRDGSRVLLTIIREWIKPAVKTSEQASDERHKQLKATW